MLLPLVEVIVFDVDFLVVHIVVLVVIAHSGCRSPTQLTIVVVGNGVGTKDLPKRYNTKKMHCNEF